MRYLIGLIIFIFLVIFVIIRLLSGGGDKAEDLPPTLASYAKSSTTVRYTIDNPTQASESHRDIIIEVGSNVSTITVTKGYEGEVIRTQSYSMNPSAYADFLLALERTGLYTRGNDDETLRDERGYCANGNRFIYEIVDADGSAIQHFWSTTCGEKTFNGKADQVRQLFRAQIPNYTELTRDVDL